LRLPFQEVFDVFSGLGENGQRRVHARFLSCRQQHAPEDPRLRCFDLYLRFIALDGHERLPLLDGLPFSLQPLHHSALGHRL
jgi:hypothetical protein